LDGDQRTMSIEVSATYENGILKLDHPLPFQDHERVTVTVCEEISIVDRTYGLLGWTGDPEVARRIAEDDEFGVLGTP
jgi:predicted DNA-binding antitoxin AbrB/MazE fold protein